LVDWGIGWEVSIERCRARIAALDAQKRDIDAAIAELTEFVAVLEAGRAQDSKKD